jgi:hypothetical protein
MSDMKNRYNSCSRNQICPFHQNPFDDCYCKKLDHQELIKATIFCFDNYQSCLIYNKNKQDSFPHKMEC